MALMMPSLERSIRIETGGMDKTQEKTTERNDSYKESSIGLSFILFIGLLE